MVLFCVQSCSLDLSAKRLFVKGEILQKEAQKLKAPPPGGQGDGAFDRGLDGVCYKPAG
jgi:hypothetical protein